MRSRRHSKGAAIGGALLLGLSLYNGCCDKAHASDLDRLSSFAERVAVLSENAASGKSGGAGKRSTSVEDVKGGAGNGGKNVGRAGANSGTGETRTGSTNEAPSPKGAGEKRTGSENEAPSPKGAGEKRTGSENEAPSPKGAGEKRAGSENADSRPNGAEKDSRLTSFAERAAALSEIDVGDRKKSAGGSEEASKLEGTGENSRLASFAERAAALSEIGGGEGESGEKSAGSSDAESKPKGTGEDSRLASFAERAAEIDSGSPEGGNHVQDDRFLAFAERNAELEREMEEKYGPVIVDNVITDPEKYNDGDRVRRTPHTIDRKQETERDDEEVADASESEEVRNLLEELIFGIESEEKPLTAEDLFEDDADLERAEAIEEAAGITELKGLVSEFEASNMEKVSLGTFRLTAYDACFLCCGKTDGITASGAHVKLGRTIAVDPALIPLGTKVMINNHVYTAEDVGGKIKGKHIDIYLNTHEEALRFGNKYAEVFLVR